MSAALLLGLLVGCSSGSGKADSDAAKGGKAAQAWRDDLKPAASAAKVGGAATPCALPVSFDLAQSWQAKPVPGELGKQGDFTLRCEVDAKPAGHIGFLRVWAGGKAGDDPAKALASFLAADKGIVDRQQRDTRAGALSAAEVTYVRNNPAVGTRKRERALAVSTPKGVVVLALGGLDTAEHEQMLPAYQLAKQSLAATA
jgi:hypothetical protein